MSRSERSPFAYPLGGVASPSDAAEGLVAQIKSVFGAKMFALGVVVKIPVPKQTAKASIHTTAGRAKYSSALDALVWK